MAAAASTHFTLAKTLLGLKDVNNPVITTSLPDYNSDTMRVNNLLLVTDKGVPGTDGLVLCNDVRLLYNGCKVIILIDTTSTTFENRKTGKPHKTFYAVPFMCTDISKHSITLITTTKLYKSISGNYEHVCDENSKFIERVAGLQSFAGQNRLYYEQVDPVTRALRGVNPDSMSELTGRLRGKKFPVHSDAITSSGRSLSMLAEVMANFLPEVPPEAAALPVENIENLPYYYPSMDATTAEKLFKEENKYIIRRSSNYDPKSGNYIYTVTLYTQHAINPNQPAFSRGNFPIKHFKIVRHSNGDLSLENNNIMFKTVDDIVQYRLHILNILFPIDGILPELTPYIGDKFDEYKNPPVAAPGAAVPGAAVPDASGATAAGPKRIRDHTLQELLTMQNTYDDSLYHKTRDEAPVIMSQNPTLRFVIRKGSTDNVLVCYKDGRIINNQLPNMGMTLKALFNQEKYESLLRDLDNHKFLHATAAALAAPPSSMIASAANAAAMPGGRRVKRYTRAHKKSRHTRGHKKSRHIQRSKKSKRTHHKTKRHRK